MAVKEENPWERKLEKSEKFLDKAHTHGRKVYKRYMDVREETKSKDQQANFFFSNVNTLRASLFNSLPTPEVSRIQKGDFQNDVSRVAALITQRSLTYEVHCAVDFSEAVKMAIIDRLVPGVGVAWVSYLESEAVAVTHVKWDDFLYDPQRLWSKVRWVARRLHLSSEDMEEAYGEKADFAGEGNSNDGSATTKQECSDDLSPKELTENTYVVYEIWDKKTRKVYHIYKGRKEPLLEIDDPLQLKDFFPCPRPMFANISPNALLPMTDYYIAQDQYIQLDVIYARIQAIVSAIKVAGLYDSENPSIVGLLTAADNKMIPVPNWAMHREAGGTAGQIEWYPVEQIATVLRELYSSFEGTKAILYEITGMSDILRGASSPYETKGAQEIKAQFASVRLNDYQSDVAIFVRDLLRIIAEIVTQLYSEEKLAKIVGELPENDRQYAPAAFQLLRDDKLMGYNVDIQANSLTQADWALEKEQKVEVVQTVGAMIAQIAQVAQQAPQLTTLGIQLVKFAITGFKSGVELESWIDTELDKMMRQQQEAEQNPQPKEPTPEEQKAQAEVQKIQMESEAKQKELEQKSQYEQMKMAMEQQMNQQKLAFEKEMGQLKLMLQQALAQSKMDETQMKMQATQEQAALDAQVAQQSATMDLQQKAVQHEQQTRFSEEDQRRKEEQGPENEGAE